MDECEWCECESPETDECPDCGGVFCVVCWSEHDCPQGD